MTVSIVDSAAIRGRDGTVIHGGATGGIYASNVLNPIIHALPVVATQALSNVTTYFKGAGVGPIKTQLWLHDFNADTLTQLGTDDTVIAAGAHSQASGLPVTPAAHQAVELWIYGTTSTLVLTGVEYTYA